MLNWKTIVFNVVAYMSIELMSVAWKIDDITSTQKLVLLALCDSANDDGICYPSVASLMKKCSLSDRGVRKCLADLEESGFITKKYRSGHSTVYVVTPAPRSPLHDMPPAPRAPTPAPDAPPPLHHVQDTPAPRAPRNIIETSIETSRKQNISTPQKILSEFGITGQVADDFIAHRKTVKATITHTAMKGFQREADKAGISIIDAVSISVERGWRGFNATWIKQGADNATHHTHETHAQRMSKHLAKLTAAQFGSDVGIGAV